MSLSFILAGKFLEYTKRKFLGIRKVSILGRETDVAVYESSRSTAGQFILLLNVIAVEKSVLETFPGTMRDYVLMHEYGHFRARWILNIVFFPIFTIFLILGSILALIAAILFAMSVFSIYFAEAFAGSILLLALLLFAFGIASWIVELQADLYAIRELGIRKVKQAFSMSSASRFPLMTRIVIRLTHPPDRFVFWFYDRFMA